jgi:hypothetical protein
MQKDAAAWLIVRTIGLLWLLLALLAALRFGANLIAIAAYEPGAGQELVRYPNLYWKPFAGFIVCSLFAFYFLRMGKVVHGWLMREDSGK